MTKQIGSVILLIFLSVSSMRTGKAMAESGGPEGIRVVIGKEIPIAVRSADEEEDPVGAWGDKGYLVVWQSTRNGSTRIYGARLNGDGQITHPDGQPDDFPVSLSPADQLFSSLAWGEKNYLVVWQDLRSHKNWEIYGARIDSTGRRLDTNDIPIGIGAGNRRHPVVAWNGQNFLAVWMEERPGTGWDIVGRRIASDGKMLGSDETIISTAAGDQTSPAVVWDGKNYFVVWMDGRKDRAQDIYGTRIDRNGKVLDPDGIVISASQGEQGYPALAWNGENTVVVWVDRRDGIQYALYGTRIDPKGTVLDPQGVPLSMTPHLHMFPDIACRKKDCLVVWEEESSSGEKRTGIQSIVRDINGLRLEISEKGFSAVSANPTISLAPRAYGNHFSRVSTDGRRYFVVWKDYRSKLAAGFGRFVDIPEVP